MGAGILCVEENCQVFSESFLLLPTTNGYSNFTLTSGQVIIPEMPDFLRKEEAKYLKVTRARQMGHSTPWWLGGLIARKQHEIGLRDLLSDVRRDQHEERHYNWVVASVALILIILLVHLTSRYWRQTLLTIASRWARLRTGTPTGVPAPKPRSVRPSLLSMIDEECTMEAKSLMGPNMEVMERNPNPERSMVPPLQSPREKRKETELPPCPHPLMWGIRSQGATNSESGMISKRTDWCIDPEAGDKSLLIATSGSPFRKNGLRWIPRSGKFLALLLSIRLTMNYDVFLVMIMYCITRNI